MRYLMNSVVITSPGTYEYRLAGEAEAQDWLDEGRFVSCIGYEETAAAIKQMFGVAVKVQRRAIRMDTGDCALIFRVNYPKGTRPDAAQKGRLGTDFLLDNCEIGFLRKINDRKTARAERRAGEMI